MSLGSTFVEDPVDLFFVFSLKTIIHGIYKPTKNKNNLFAEYSIYRFAMNHLKRTMELVNW